jgi:hypothetical protein
MMDIPKIYEMAGKPMSAQPTAECFIPHSDTTRLQVQKKHVGSLLKHRNNSQALWTNNKWTKEELLNYV